MGAPDDEVGLVQRSRAGDPDAFSVLVARYERMVKAVAYRMTGSATDAEDLAQETFVRAYRHLEGYRGEASFRSWLGRVAINLCLDWAGRERRRDSLHSAVALEVAEQTVAPAGSVAAEETDEVAERVNAALLRLPPKQRAAMILTVHEELSHADAARVLGCSEATVSWRVFAARIKLRRWLKADLSSAHHDVAWSTSRGSR